MAVKVLDAGGGKVLISSTERGEVDAALQRYLTHGAKVISAASLIGKSWVAACTPPTQKERLDDTMTLRLSDLNEAQRAAEAVDETSLCSVEEVGFKRIIRGPTRAVVSAKIEELVHFGAAPIGEVEEIDGAWVAMCDTAGVQNSGFRW